jgi:hypothetical protein
MSRKIILPFCILGILNVVTLLYSASPIWALWESCQMEATPEKTAHDSRRERQITKQKMMWSDETKGV